MTITDPLSFNAEAFYAQIARLPRAERLRALKGARIALAKLRREALAEESDPLVSWKSVMRGDPISP